MAYHLTWSPYAQFDLREIFAYITEDNPIAAGKFIRSLIDSVECLPSFPESGRIVPEFGDPSIRVKLRTKGCAGLVGSRLDIRHMVLK